MTKESIFWAIFIISLVFGLWSHWGAWSAFGMSIVEYVLIGLLGWKVFGPAVK